MKNDPSKCLTTELESSHGLPWALLTKKKKKKGGGGETAWKSHYHKTPETLTPMTEQWTPPTTSPLSVCRLLALYGMWELQQDHHPDMGQEVALSDGSRSWRANPT